MVVNGRIMCDNALPEADLLLASLANQRFPQMWLVIANFTNGSVRYYGPFPTQNRAILYSMAVEADVKPASCHIACMVTPRSKG